MTGYTTRELAEDWEFKIIHSFGHGFRNPDRLQDMLDEEARAGWVLVEKFDNQRVRLKRPAKAKFNDKNLDFDPYRTTVGGLDNRAALVFFLMVGILVASCLAALLLARIQ